MIYSDKVKKAIEIAFEVHKNQLDKGGYPYIMHPLHLAEQMDTEEEVVVAVLHDVLEDSEDENIALKLRTICLTVREMQALQKLTHKNDQTYKEYIQAIKSNELATKIKIADLKHNMDVTRILKTTSSSEELYKVLKHMERYVVALKELGYTPESEKGRGRDGN